MTLSHAAGNQFTWQEMESMYVGKTYRGDGRFHENGRTKTMTVFVMDTTGIGSVMVHRRGFGQFPIQQKQWLEFVKTAKEIVK